MRGKLYGIGVGPGDPKLLTLRAVEVLKDCDLLVAPAKDKEHCVAYQIARAAVPELDEKEVLCLDMPMTKDKEKLTASHDACAKLLKEKLDTGKTVGFLTLGDPTLYSTYLYVHARIKAEYETQIISGIASPLAACGALGIGLAEADEQIHIIPASYGIEEALAYPGTKVLMKAGKKIKDIRSGIKDSRHEIYMVENCGMENERIVIGADAIPDNSGYYSIVILKEKK